MLQITRVLENVILPPGGLILLVVIGLVFLLAKRRKTAAVILAAALIGSYLLSIGPISGAVMIPLEDSYPALSQATLSKAESETPGPDAVVILGGGSIVGAPDAPGIRRMAGTTDGKYSSYVSLSPDGTDRLAYGFALSRASGLPIIVAGGAPLKEPGTESEAAAAKALLVAMGADPARIRTENASRTTWENAVDVALKFNPKRIVLVTSAYHMRRAVYCFRKQGIDVIPAPTNYTVSRTPGGAPELTPSAYSLQTSATAIRERIAYLFYRLRYGTVPK